MRCVTSDGRAGGPSRCERRSYMAVDFENSQTKKNLEAAFAGESQATNKYSYYASKAK